MKPRSHAPLLQPGHERRAEHYGPRLGVGGEIPLQRSNLPTHRDHDFKVFGIAWQYRWGGGY